MNYVQKLPPKPQAEVNPDQGILDLRVDRQGELDGIGMGVLNDGTPFLSQRGLARLCGVQNAHIGTISREWNEQPTKPRIQAIKAILESRGLTLASPHIVIGIGAQKMYAYPEPLCMAVLEYYAFDAGQFVQQEAKQKYRWLATRSLREVIYAQLNYKPKSEAAEAWRQFHDRVSLVYDSVPDGYFCIFKEIADLMVTLIDAGAPVGESFIPDISVGIAWSKHWRDNALYSDFGERQRYAHNYPPYFPQAVSNPQTPYCYPDSALPEFRRWMKKTYLPSGLPTYLKKKVSDGELTNEISTLAISAVLNRGRSKIPQGQLPPPTKRRD